MEDRFQNFTLQINKINRSIHRIKAEEMKKFNLKSAHVSCLYYLYKHQEPMTSKELCDVCEEDKALISRALDDLEKRGYIHFNSSTEKRYRSPIELQPDGKEVAKYIVARIDALLDAAGMGMDEKTRGSLYEGLSTISSNLEKICKEGKRND